jgi:RHH-type proline utilization regulon transcriptional repressor/proline dehydrogenase/delta 1-pyrroline-5-carboxylate dehydrogenase
MNYEASRWRKDEFFSVAVKNGYVPTFPTDPKIDATAVTSVAQARNLIHTAETIRARRDKANRKRFARLFKDPKAIEVTITLTDEVMRIHSTKEAVAIFSRAAKKASVRGFGLFNAIGLKKLRAISPVLPRFVIALVHQRVRALSRGLILPYEAPALTKILRQRTKEGIRLNINVLGEAVLGQHEADTRFKQILEMVARPDVDYISVKLSAVVAQMVTIDHAGSLTKVCERLRVLYRAAQENKTFINLDMEEYRDLALTVAAFKKVLSEAEFGAMTAGIVLQAYLPESHAAFYELANWAKSRHKKYGGTIKIRLVKGANLAMERAEAEFNGWSAAPYASKSDVDASYSRLIDAALRPENAEAVRIGIASHNLFHLTWAIEVARKRHVLNQLDIEMLEGMASAEALAVTQSGHQVLLYAPVTRRDDFASAVAYLVRRLDENTSDENYLKAAFDIAKNPKKFAEQKKRFENSVRERHTITTASRRHLLKPDRAAGFFNEPSGDPTEPKFIAAVTEQLAKVQLDNSLHIPVVINGKETITKEQGIGTDPSADGAQWYSYSVIDKALVDKAIAAAEASTWSKKSAAERRSILEQVAASMSEQRARSIAVMARDAGKTVSEADPEVSEAIDFARFYAAMIDDDKSTPIGPVLVIPPWNFPYAIPAGGLFAALAAGNPVLFKPAPETVATAWELAQQLWDAGIPYDALQFLPSLDDENGQYLVTHPSVKALILTGAFDTANMFVQWRNDLNLLAETSGKNTLVITACADIDAAVKDLVQSAFGHAGQKCSAASLGIIIESIYKDPAFTRQLIDDVSSLKVGAGYHFSTSVGPIIRPPDGNLSHALHHLEPGESWLLEPEQLDHSGHLWRPGIKVGVKPGSWSHRNEWFGPVLALMVAPNLKTAVQWQNATDFGLTAGIHSLDPVELDYWMEHVEAGNLYINRGITGAIVNRQPFGGWKRSSVGATAKAGGHHYVNSLRNWAPIQHLDLAKRSATKWWNEVGSQAIDHTGLNVEKNYHRYRRPLAPIIVRFDSETARDETAYAKFISDLTGAAVEFSSSKEESVAELVERARGKVRWLSHEEPPRAALLAKGISLDMRPIAQRGDIETPRWLLEQSVCITYHRYGNTNGGPKPACPGLGH